MQTSSSSSRFDEPTVNIRMPCRAANQQDTMEALRADNRTLRARNQELHRQIAELCSALGLDRR